MTLRGLALGDGFSLRVPAHTGQGKGLCGPASAVARSKANEAR